MISELNNTYNQYKEKQLYGRYITNEMIETCLSKLPKSCVEILGRSVESRPIYGVRFGSGSMRILMWSQMHGNESTTTKAMFDLFNFLIARGTIAEEVLSSCSFLFIPILNPDGAWRYTRFNANNIDLNRDAQERSQPESRILLSAFKSFNPDFCFNLHGQRTIFGAGPNGKAATLSFLAPAQDVARSLSSNRKRAMSLIANLHAQLKGVLPEGIGRYDDSFNLNCVGDTFQSFGVPTVLFESGHYPNDYQREEVRRYVFLALILGLEHIVTNPISESVDGYLKTPNNAKSFRDIGITNALLSKNSTQTKTIIIQYKEVLKEGKVEFRPEVEAIMSECEFKFHRTIDAKNQLVETTLGTKLTEGYENDFVLINNEKIALNP